MRLAACVIVQRGGSLATLAEALGISIPAVREGLDAIGERLAAVGMRAVEDGDMVRVAPVAVAAGAVAAVTSLQPLPEISASQLEVIAIVAHLGSATRREIERVRGEDSENLIRRLVERGLLERARETPGGSGPNTYRITATALGLTGHPTIESLQAYLDQAMASAEGASGRKEQRGLLLRPSAVGGGSPGEASQPQPAAASAEHHAGLGFNPQTGLPDP